MGDSNADDPNLPLCIQAPKLTGQWYLEDDPGQGVYDCVRDCIGGKPCGGRVPMYTKLFSTFDACCQAHTWWTGCSPPDGKSECSDSFWDT